MSEATGSGELVTVATFQEPIEANLARTALESAGIEVVLRGENANSMIPAAFTSELQVQAGDEAAARAVLAEAEDSPESMQAVTEAEIADEQAGR